MTKHPQKTRILSLILTLLLTAPVLSSCSESAVNTETTAPVESSADPAAVETLPEETELQPDLPDITFDDQSFTILTSGVMDAGQDWLTYDIWVESMNG